MQSSILYFFRKHSGNFIDIVENVQQRQCSVFFEHFRISLFDDLLTDSFLNALRINYFYFFNLKVYKRQRHILAIYTIHVS